MPIDGYSPSTPVVLRPHGFLRVLPCAFLSFWLCGWAVGEGFAIVAGLSALHALVGAPIPSWLPNMKVSAGAAIPLLLFLSVWLALWTFGGISAMAAIAGMLWGSEEITWDSQQIEVTQRAFPFVYRRHHAWADILRLESSRTGGVVAVTRRGCRSITSIGTSGERNALSKQLHAAWRAAHPDAEGGSLVQAAASLPIPEELPLHWKAEPDESGQLAATEPPGPKRLGGILLAAFAVALAAVIAKLVTTAQLEGWTGGRAAAVALLSLLDALMTFGAAILAFTRQSVHPRPGMIVRREHRFGRTRETAWSPARLELQSSSDSDGDEWWKLVVSGGPAKPFTIVSVINDPEPALRLGRWLASRSGVPFVDAAPGSRRPAA